MEKSSYFQMYYCYYSPSMNCSQRLRQTEILGGGLVWSLRAGGSERIENINL